MTFRPVISVADGCTTPDATKNVFCDISKSKQYTLSSPVSNLTDIKSASAGSEANSDAEKAIIVMTPAGKKAIADYSTKAFTNPAKPPSMAIVADGYVIFVAELSSAILGGVIELSLDSPAEAQHLVAILPSA